MLFASLPGALCFGVRENRLLRGFDSDKQVVSQAGLAASLFWQMLFCQFLQNRTEQNRPEQSRTEHNRTEQRHEVTCLVRSSYLRRRAFPFFCCPLALLFTQSSSEAMLRCKLSCCLFSVCTTHPMSLLLLAVSSLLAFGLP